MGRRKKEIIADELANQENVSHEDEISVSTLDGCSGIGLVESGNSEAGNKEDAISMDDARKLINNLVNTVKNVNIEYTELAEVFSACKEKINDFKNLAVGMKNKMDETLSEKDSKIQELEETIRVLVSSNKTLTDANGALTKELSNASMKIFQLDKEVKLLKEIKNKKFWQKNKR